MTTPEHTSEPWTAEHTVAGRWYIRDNDDGPLADMRQGEAEQGANARRIVACVNACAGLPTEALESGALAKPLAVLKVASTHSPSCHSRQAVGFCVGCDARDALRALGQIP